jgi:putative ABC transport system permease protein
MIIRENIKLALRNVRANLLRTILTLLIIAFGIMALVGVLTAIDSAIYSLNDNFSDLGANSFSIKPSGEGIRGNRRGRQAKIADPISFKEAEEFKERFDFPGKVSINFSCTGIGVIKYGNEKTNPNVSVFGVDENYLDVYGFELAHGRNFNLSELQHFSKKALIGQDIVNLIFDGKSEFALNKVISIGNVKFRVIGVLASKGSSMNQSSDRQVFIPITVAKQIYATSNTNYRISAAAKGAENLDEDVSHAISVMRNVRRLKASQDNDFEIAKSDGLIDIIKEDTLKLRLSAIAIGLITLLGAAIGLMNIMLVSVTERTREVGICKALGATNENILQQFLTEAIVICQLGGIVGVILGIIIGNIVTYLLGGDFLIPWGWMILGISICFLVGLLSGLYPALKAAKLDPIESLRYE